MSIPEMSEAELDAYLEQVSREGSDEELEALVNTIKQLQNDYIFAKQKAVQEAEIDRMQWRQIAEAKRDDEIRRKRHEHEQRLQRAENLLRKEREYDPSRGT